MKTLLALLTAALFSGCLTSNKINNTIVKSIEFTDIKETVYVGDCDYNIFVHAYEPSQLSTEYSEVLTDLEVVNVNCLDNFPQPEYRDGTLIFDVEALADWQGSTDISFTTLFIEITAN